MWSMQGCKTVLYWLKVNEMCAGGNFKIGKKEITAYYGWYGNYIKIDKKEYNSKNIEDFKLLLRKFTKEELVEFISKELEKIEEG